MPFLLFILLSLGAGVAATIGVLWLQSARRYPEWKPAGYFSWVWD